MIAREIYQFFRYRLERFEWEDVVRYILVREMTNLHTEKIRKWFPGINQIDMERKIFDECVSFLEKGKLPYYDLKV